MTSEPLPLFRYHADPVATGSVAVSDNECVCCEQARGYIYTGPVSSEDEHQDDIWQLDGDEWEEYFKGLDKDDQPTAYVFRCLHCQRIGGYSDFT